MVRKGNAEPESEDTAVDFAAPPVTIGRLVVTKQDRLIWSQLLDKCGVAAYARNLAYAMIGPDGVEFVGRKLTIHHAVWSETATRH